MLIDKHSQKTMCWLVVAVGPGKWNASGTHRLPPQYKPGDILLAYKLTTFHKYPGHAELTLGRDVWVIAEDVFVGPVPQNGWPTIPHLSVQDLVAEAAADQRLM